MPRILLLAACLLAGTAAHAQPLLRYGVSGGLALATQSPGEDSRSGFNVGVYAEVAPLPFLAVGADLSYVQKGQRFDNTQLLLVEGDTVLTAGTSTIALDYASFAVTAKPSVSLSPRGPEVYAVLGPRLDLLLREKLLFGSDDVEDFTVTTERNASTVFGYDVGVGVRLRTLLPTPVFAEARFSGDLSEVIPEAPDVRNQVVQLRLGLDF
ncbi:MAG: outer membrane beta-barrel protein [Bacteroidota bacterium]